LAARPRYWRWRQIDEMDVEWLLALVQRLTQSTS
jgi:hypothetical protein